MIVEEVERDSWIDMMAAMPPDLAERYGLVCRRIGSVFCSSVTAFSDSTFNRAMCLGVGVPAEEGDLERLIEHFKDAGAPTWWLQLSCEATLTDLRQRAVARGFRARSAPTAKMVRDASPPPHIATDLDVREVDPGDVESWAEVVRVGFGMGWRLKAWLGALGGRPSWHLYAGYDGERVVAAGALWLEGDRAWLGLGATLPEARGRGGQGAIMARRIADAIASGAQVLVTDVANPQPDQPNHSYNNMVRCGFRLQHLRDSLESPG